MNYLGATGTVGGSSSTLHASCSLFQCAMLDGWVLSSPAVTHQRPTRSSNVAALALAAGEAGPPSCSLMPLANSAGGPCPVMGKMISLTSIRGFRFPAATAIVE